MAANSRLRGWGLFLIGVAIFFLGTGPLLLLLALAKLGLTSDPDTNPVMLGMMSFFTFWPSIGIMLVGLFFGLIKLRSQS